MAGLVSAGAVTVLVVSQPAPVKQVQFVAPVDSTPTPTVEPVVTTTEAPTPVESTTTAAPVVAPKEAVVVPKVIQPTAPSSPGTYQDGTPVKKRADGTVIMLPEPPVDNTCVQQIDGHGVPIPLPASCP